MMRYVKKCELIYMNNYYSACVILCIIENMTCYLQTVFRQCFYSSNSVKKIGRKFMTYINRSVQIQISELKLV